MVSEVVRGKALAHVVERARVTDASGNVVELKNLRPDGTIGDPAAEAEVEAEADVDVEAGAETPAEG
jgi:trigger factor